MPFTFSHPALVIPFLRQHKRYLSATGLVIGSMAPDFESIISLNPHKVYGHTWLGIFWFDTPLALVLCVMFHLCVRAPLIKALPANFEEKFAGYATINWFKSFFRRLPILVGSIIIGATSHLLWDALTHLNLREPDSISSGVRFMGIRVYKILQYISSAIGLVLIYAEVQRLPSTKLNKTSFSKFTYWLYIALGCILVFSIENSLVSLEDHFDLMVVVYMVLSSATCALIVTSLAYRIFIRTQN